MSQRLGAILLAPLCLLAADHPGCNLYPQPLAPEVLRISSIAESSRPSKLYPRAAVARVNWIDDHIFGRIEAAGIESAPLADDATFLRRVMLDLTGRIPTPAQVSAFLEDSSSTKRLDLVDRLLASPEYVDQFALYWANRFQVTSSYYQLIGIPGRNLFNRYLRDFVAEDRPLTSLATELITATGDTHRLAPGNFLMRGIQQGDPIQDTWDTLTNTVTTEFLGVQTQCVSCHDGRRHLEEINLYLVRRRRDEFMALSAFFSRMQITEVGVDAFNQQRKGIIADAAAGAYHGVVNPQNPGSRPPRVGIYEPVFLFTEAKPQSELWRRDLARLITSDRQFARAAVNYLWAYMFNVGIVDPPNAWDLARIDPANPPPAPWTLQPSHPELLEALATEFINSGYRVRPILRLLAQSAAYQLSSSYPGQWNPSFARYFARHFARRLSAEEVYDALVTSTLTETPLYVEGFDQPLLYASQLPDVVEPGSNNNVFNFLTNLGRGNWWRNPRSSQSSVVQALYLMNDNMINSRTFGNARNLTASTRVAQLAASPMPETDAVRQLFLATLGRAPSDSELAILQRHRKGDRESWLTDVQWALLNRAEFLFNH